MEKKIKEFKPTSWSIDNKTSMYVLAIIIAIFGLINYYSIPKEQFPEIVIPTIIVNTVYLGTSPADMENLVTRPLEKNIKSINGVKKITSKSIQDISSIVVEFNTGIEVSDCKQKVKDAVDKTKKDLPNNLTVDPSVSEIDFSEIPIMYVNISGNYDLAKLKKYSDIVKDKVETLKEITRADIVGALDREIQINMDMYKMQAASVSFNDVKRTVSAENMTISGGTIEMQGMSRSIRIVGELPDIETLKNVIIPSSSGALVRLKDIADVKDTFKEQESFARLDGKNVITLNIIKKSGQNLIEASDKIKIIIEDLKANKFPKDLKVTVTGDMSRYTRTTLADLNNTIIIGFLLVTVVLMFFMGLTNALFVGLSVPLSMALCYIAMPSLGFTMNMLVMFSFIFALGIIVDDAIVVIENTHRVFKKEKVDIITAAKHAAGEVFIPILSGTLTTLAPFFPLAFWPGVVGKFMFYIPVTLIMALFASLIVAYILNPVFAVSFMKHDEDEAVATHRENVWRNGLILAGAAAVFYCIWFALGMKYGLIVGFAGLIILVGISYVAHNLYGYRVLRKFQKQVIPAMLLKYEKLIRWVLVGRRPYKLINWLFVLLIVSFFITGLAKPKVVFFPVNQPNSIQAFIKLPVGTDVKVTDSVTRMVEARIVNVLGENNPIVESVISNVALGASDQIFDSGSKTSNRGKVTVNFVEFALRQGQSTLDYLDKLRNAMDDIPGVEITIDKNKMGPPTGKALSIEITGENLEELTNVSESFIRYIDSLKIEGIEELKSDFERKKPELIIDIDRERANHEGLTTGQIGNEIRIAVLGDEVSKYRDGEDQYPIQLRYNEYTRKDIERLLNLKITYRDMNSGLLRQIPLSSVANVKYQNTYGGINRKNLKRIIILSSNVLSGFTPNEVNMAVRKSLKGFDKPDSIDISLGGEQEDQKESMAFLSRAMLLSLFLVLFILITQFNSISKPIIIISEVLFSIIGVLLGYTIFHMTFSIIMTGIGIVALAGIVVRNGILLVEFTDVLKSQGMKTRDAIVKAGTIRITPVVLTATATMLGLIPLAIGFNINFVTLLTEFNPHIHFGGDSVTFFGGLAWTIVFGLSFATFLTLIFIPAMYYVIYVRQIRKLRRKSNRTAGKK